MKAHILKKKALSQTTDPTAGRWPDRHLHSDDNKPLKFHLAQEMTWDSPYRITLMSAGTQGGKTSFGPWWLQREIYSMRGLGDYIAVTSSFDLFKLKMLPAMLTVFEGILGVGRYWGGDRVIELRDPKTGDFWAKRATDQMWGRIILRSADALGGLESATAKGAWLDECGQDRFTFNAYKAIRRRVALHRGRILMTSTLYGLGWLTYQIIDPAIADGKTRIEQIGESEIELTDCPERDVRVVQFDSILNPAFPMQEYEEARQLLPDEEFQMFYRGRKAIRRFLIYDTFDLVTMTCEPFPIPPTWRRFAGMDFGGAHTSAVFYAEEPGTGRLYAYREYLAGDKDISEHVKDLLQGEIGIPLVYGGARSEDQWRREFGANGLPIHPPETDDVDLGINRVYAQHTLGNIIYFKNLSGIIEEKGRYRRKRDKEGKTTDDIENKNAFHRLDAERYLIATIRPGGSLTMKIINLGDGLND